MSNEGESEEHFGFVSTEVTTLAADTVFKDVSIFLQDQKGNPESAAEFELIGADEGNEQIFLSGLSKEDGRLVDFSGEEPLDVFKLQTGNYQLYVYTEGGEEFVIEFEVLESEDFMNNPLNFVLDVDQPNVDEGKTPSENDEKDPPEVTFGDDNPTNEDGKTPIKNTSAYNLPSTATDFYNLLLIGVVLILIGVSIYVIRSRKMSKI
ncbi:LPXTG cell wall anchor domain-containing protein [Metabacillus herbersteinensis]|uniref:LPXTG cell wall anchor domain-containing protein n=1 Tax=Metabacillus herbersteinensis TaxID=283816 RepID=A0ABV6GF88_9BACI